MNIAIFSLCSTRPHTKKTTRKAYIYKCTKKKTAGNSKKKYLNHSMFMVIENRSPCSYHTPMHCSYIFLNKRRFFLGGVNVLQNILLKIYVSFTSHVNTWVVFSYVNPFFFKFSIKILFISVSKFLKWSNLLTTIIRCINIPYHIESIACYFCKDFVTNSCVIYLTYMLMFL